MFMEATPPKKQHSLFYAILIFFEIIFLLGFGVGFYTFFVPDNPISQWWKGRATATTEVKDLTEKIGQLAVLPTGEAPTVATVSDRAKLQNQPFFAHAENGDKVLIFANAKKAFLYRPSINKIIEIAPISFTQPNQTAPALKSAVPAAVTAPVIASASAMPVSVVIYNGSKTGDSTAAVEQLLKDKAPNISIASRAKATLSYSKNLVVDLRGNNREMVTILANIIGGEVSAMPSGEAVPKAPILIILGK